MRKRNRNFKAIGLAGILVVGLSVAGLPVEPVSAANGWEVDLNAGGTAEASSVSITMGSSTANGQLSAGSTDPNKSAGLVKRTASVEIGATDGYTVTLSGNPNLTGTNGNNKIPTVTSNTTLAQMNNQWGWYTAEGDVDCSALQIMKQMKSTGDQIAAGTLDAKTTKQFTMCFGAKVNGNQAADTYSNTVTLSVVAQPKVVQTFGGIKTMQEMTSSICGAAAVNDTAYLRDTRDNKSCWVTKLADGNCWMSQNLDLDITTSNVKAADSDVTSDWNSSSSYPPVATFDNSNGEITYGSTFGETETYSWDLGKYVLEEPSKISSNSACASATGLSACSSQGFVSIGSDYVASDDPNFYKRELYQGTDGTACTKSANSAVNFSATGACKVYDAHYTVGNYYYWNAVTAGTGGTITNANATGSICPKGWRLPNAGSEAALNKGAFAYLLMQYGLATTWDSGALSGIGNSSVAGTSGLSYEISLSPLFFVGGGYVQHRTLIHNGSNGGNGNPFMVQRAGEEGYLWSSRAYSYSSSAVYLSLDGSEQRVYPSDYNSRYFGFSVRCLVSTP